MSASGLHMDMCGACTRTHMHPHTQRTCIRIHTHTPCIHTEREKEKNLCLFQIPITFFTEVERKILECIQKHKDPNSQHTKGVISPNFKQNDSHRNSVIPVQKQTHRRMERKPFKKPKMAGTALEYYSAIKKGETQICGKAGRSSMKTR